MSPAGQDVLDRIVADSVLRAKYAERLDRDSAHEMLAERLEPAAPAEPAPVPGERVSYPPRRPPAPQEGGAVQDILTSPMAKDLARTAVREIFRGVFGTRRRR
jgi:hypothetical protein